MTIKLGDTVTWPTRYGYRTGGRVVAIDDGIATVNSVGYARSKCVPLTRVAVDKLELA